MNTPFYIADLYHTLWQAKMCKEVWWLLVSDRADRDIILEAYNLHLDFFDALRPSMFVSYVILTSTLFEERNANKSVTLKSIPGIESAKDFATLWERGRKLYGYRSKCIAHRDSQNNRRNFAEKTGLTYDEITSIIDDSCRLYNDYCLSLGYPTLPGTDISAGDDLLQIIGKLTHNRQD